MVELLGGVMGIHDEATANSTHQQPTQQPTLMMDIIGVMMQNNGRHVMEKNEYISALL